MRARPGRMVWAPMVWRGGTCPRPHGRGYGEARSGGASNGEVRQRPDLGISGVVPLPDGWLSEWVAMVLNDRDRTQRKAGGFGVRKEQP